MNILTFDIGGMSIKYTIFNNSKKLFPIKKIDSRDSNKKITLDIIKKVYLEHKNEISGIAISSPGGITKDGYINGVNAIKNWNDFYVDKEIKKYLNYDGPITVINDGNAVAYSDYSTLAKGSSSVSIAVGTGIGAGIVIEGNLINGVHGFAGEVGSISSFTKDNFKFDDLMTMSGMSGFYYLEKNYEKISKIKKSGKEIFDQLKEGDLIAKKVVDEMYKGIALMIFNIAVTINPDYFFIAGGLGLREEFPNEIKPYFDTLLKRANFKFPLIKLKISKYKWESQIFGAYKYFIDNHN